MQKALVAATVAGLVGVAGAANAADIYTRGGLKDEPSYVANEILAANNQIGVAFVATNFDYLETNGGTKLDSEKGWAPGFGLSYSLMRNFFVSNLYFRADYTFLDGSTDYVGGTNLHPAYGSLKNTDGATVHDFDFRIGKGFELRPEIMATPYLGVGYHYWYRELPGAGGYKEDYTHAYVGSGLLLQWSPMQKVVLSAHGLIGKTLSPNLTSYDTPISIDVSLGEKTYYRAGLSVDYALTGSIHANAAVEFVGYKYGKSAVAANGYLEPDSRTENTTVKVGLGYSLGNDYTPLK